MTTYYRTTDRALVELTAAQFAALSASKRDTLKVYSIDPPPVSTSLQNVTAGPIVVEGLTARRTWALVDKSPEQLVAEQFTAQRDADLAQIRLIYAALKNGTGTAAERLTRCERVLARLLKDVFGGEPA